jgi:hypothetical protein
MDLIDRGPTLNEEGRRILFISYSRDLHDPADLTGPAGGTGANIPYGRNLRKSGKAATGRGW